MYCEKCKSEINDGSVFCPVCGEKISTNNGNDTEYQMPGNFNSNINSNSLEKCAWFAPVSAIISFILVYVVNALETKIRSNNSNSSYDFYFIAVFSIVRFVVGFIPFFITYVIAVSKIEKNKSKIVMPIIFFVYFLNSIPDVITSIIYYICFGILNENTYSNFRSSTVPVITTIVSVVFHIVFAVCSYLIVAKYFKDVDILLSENQLTGEKSEVADVSQQQNQTASNMKQALNTPIKSQKSKVSAGLLCFFLGELGVHRFYVGKVGTGILWMLTFGLCGIGSLVDLFLIICGSFKDSNGLELS